MDRSRSRYDGRGHVSRWNGPNNRCRVTVETGASGRIGQDATPPMIGIYDPWPGATLHRARSRRRRQSGPGSAYNQDQDAGPNPYLPYPPNPLADDMGAIPEVPERSDVNSEQDYDFDLPNTPAATRYAEVIDFPLPDNNQSDSEMRSFNKKFNGPMTEVRILHSHWLGNVYDRGELSSEISTMADAPTQSEKSPRRLMRWCHLERQMMNFEEFMAACDGALQLHENEHRYVVRLLRDMQRKYEQQRQNGREMDPAGVSDTFYSDPKDSRQQTASVQFLAFPYFCLEKYDTTQMRALAPGSPLHPLRPLLQDHFYSTTQKRELAQAVTTMSHTEDGECVHISQVWCLIVNDNTVVTCSRLSFDSLCGSSIRQSATTATDLGTRIKVTCGSDRTWSVPISDSTTWPAFLSIFDPLRKPDSAQVDDPLQFLSPKGIVNGQVWHHMYDLARQIPVTLTMKTSQPQQPPPYEEYHVSPVYDRADHAQPLDWKRPRAVKPSLGSTVSGRKSKGSTVGTYLQLFRQGIDLSTMQDQADMLHRVLISNNRAQERELYNECPSANISDVEDWLEGRQSDQAEAVNKSKRKFAVAAKYYFASFWPVDYQHPMIEKYWGAVLTTLKRPVEFFDQGQTDPKLDQLEASLTCHTLHETVYQAMVTLTEEFLGYESDLLPLPDAFSKAWLHLITAFILAAKVPLMQGISDKSGSFHKHLDAIGPELNAGHTDISARIRYGSLEDMEVCTSLSLVALVVNHVSQDIMDGKPDVASIYSDYFQGLESAIIENPLPRVHQEKLRYFLQEVEAVLATLRQQESVVGVYRGSIEQQKRDQDIYIWEGLGQSRQAVVTERCRAAIESKIDNLTGLQRRAQELGEWHRNEIETNKDQQEAAIIVFTIVTIIFLPLSFISSVFGMNTNDIRNMSQNQWAYWAAAIPVTFVVVVGSLWWAGFFEGLGSWLSKTLSRPSKSGASKEIPYARTEEEASISRRRRMARRRSRSGRRRDSPQSRRRKTYPIRGYLDY